MATKTAGWTADDLDRLPDDGNRYEVVDGELFVTPAPSVAHQAVQMALVRRLIAFDPDERRGWLFAAPADVYFDRQNRVQPDLIVVPHAGAKRPRSWKEAPRPILIVEILSPTTATRDLEAKREAYLEFGIPTYWIVDHEERLGHVVRPHVRDVTVRDTLEWRPGGHGESLVIDLPALFREALDD